MQERRSNADRRAETRTALVRAARERFATHGYANTGTPDLVAAAGVTRGALYHHFRDKQDLFRAVITAEAEAVATTIDRATQGTSPGNEALRTGADAFFAAMAIPGRTRLMLVEGPAVLGPAAMREIDTATGAATLRHAIAAAAPPGTPSSDIDARADLASAMFDRAALAIDTGTPAEPYRQALHEILFGLILNHTRGPDG
ncbi:TetR/AcrR family transcriptional regulator [Algicella marina]|uniref:TetR family transcriptional regulator n=1 Tax=Algicella marina TaxID=2683284 RepID=A0A6P1SWS4_9RHOB|nr:TetR/AcrR family transcriptional regulator [Algicella marina]QHQ34207.1 TetR family transcriptional regulator [Algicella marina]